MRGSHHGLVAKSGILARGRIHLCKPLCVRSKPALAKAERTIHFPRRSPSTQGCPGSGSRPGASALSSLAPTPSAASPAPPASRHTPCANGSTSAPRFPLLYTPVLSSSRSRSATSICRNRFTTCSGWYFLPRPICSPCPVSLFSSGTFQAGQSKRSQWSAEGGGEERVIHLLVSSSAARRSTNSSKRP